MQGAAHVISRIMATQIETTLPGSATNGRRKSKPKTPFSISPNPNNLYFTPSLEAAVFRTRFCVEQRQGLAVIIGAVGLGKTSLVRYLHTDFDSSEDTVSVLIPTPTFKTEFAMIANICQLVGLPPRRSAQKYQSDLEGWLQEQYRQDFNVVLFIDEAQKLTDSMLEMVRAFLNFETNEEKLVQIVLAGQMELSTRLRSQQHKPLYSRMIAPTVMSTLTVEEVSGMIAHRCKLHKLSNPFPAETVERLWMLTGGIPRETLRVCSMAYEMSKLANLEEVPVELLEMAYQEMQLRADDTEAD
jgi:general secretion pathway protein A